MVAQNKANVRIETAISEVTEEDIVSIVDKVPV